MNSFSINKIASILAIFTITLFLLEGCKKKETTIGSDFLDSQKFNSGTYRDTQIKSFTTQRKETATSNVSHNLVGVYSDPIFGTIKSSFGIQVILSEEDPDFGTSPIIDSVVLTMPFINEGTDTTHIVYGDLSKSMTLEISQLQDLYHPDTTYYSDIVFSHNPAFSIIPNFEYSPDSLTLGDGSKIGPAFITKLDDSFFQTNVLDQGGTSSLVNNSNFLHYFYGLHFEVTENDGHLIPFEMTNGASLILYYKNSDKDSKGDPLPQQNFELEFSTKVSRINSYNIDETTISDPSSTLLAQIGGDTLDGAETMYLQGMSGLEGNIKLFTNTDQLNSLRDSSWLINDAQLVYRVTDNNGSGDGIAPPFKLLMANRDTIDANNGGDYRLIDNVVEPILFGGSLQTSQTILDVNKEKRYYKFKITNHVASILDGEYEYDDNGEKKLDENGNSIFKYNEENNFPIKLIPLSGSESPSRVEVYGNKNSDDKKLFLEIHYSKKIK